MLTTGGSVSDIRRHVQRRGALVIGASVIANRGAITAASLGVDRLTTLVDVGFETFEANECSLCEDGIPIVLDVGKGQRFRQTNPDYAGGCELLLATLN